MSTRRESGLGRLMPMLLLMTLSITCVAGMAFSDSSFLGFTSHCSVTIVPDIPAVPISSSSSNLFTITVNGNGDNPIVEPGQDGTVYLSGTGISPSTVNVTTSGGTAKASLTAPAITSTSSGLSYTATIFVHTPGDIHVSRTNETHVIIWKTIIKQNGVDISGSTQDTIVGRKISLQGFMDPDADLEYAKAWNIPGTPIGGWVVAEDSTFADVEELYDESFIGDYINYYWVDGQDGRDVTYAIYYGNKTDDATTTFNVKRPTVSVAVTHKSPTIDPNYFLGRALHIGNTPQGDHGIDFDFGTTLNEPTNFTGGDTEWIQLMNDRRSVQMNALDWWHTTGSGLDQIGYPYPKDSNTAASDSPGMPVDNTYHKVKVDDSYVMYLMYKPTGDACWVPMQSITWSWSGTGTRTGIDTWNLDTSNPPNPIVADCTTEPEWTQIGYWSTWTAGE